MKPDRSAGYVDAEYLKAAAQLLLPTKTRSYSLMRLEQGSQALDVGCGIGIDTLAIAEAMGPEGSVLGVDADASMVATANERAEQAGLADRVSHRVGNACTLPLESLSVDACRSERLFMHLTDPALALGEMIRVTRQGGWVVVVDPDWGALSIDTTQTDTERKLVRFHAERLLTNGYSGRQLFRLFAEAGLKDVQIEVQPIAITGNAAQIRYLARLDEVEQGALDAGLVEAEALDAWRSELALRGERGTLFGSTNMVLAAGRKP
ncbi:methyltransferase domain-containing protein [Thiocystis violacea]|uniref:methyltransferase domain-containing protein n=1 Tax=Thiocystis violacea TaxID=13725 RepID=UPI001908301E|nr:methyltransferase domain-containing protein [Thiocystis violacea]MBK1722470.1 hypothetical protein [Thiocystis violacea]